MSSYTNPRQTADLMASAFNTDVIAFLRRMSPPLRWVVGRNTLLRRRTVFDMPSLDVCRIVTPVYKMPGVALPV